MKSAQLETLEIISNLHNYNQWVYSHFKPYLQGDVLDIGSGIGNIVQYFENSAAQKIIASDGSREMFFYLQKKFSGHKLIKTLHYDITLNVSSGGINKSEIDTITSANVLEHIENQPAALKNMHTLLQPQGKLILFVPALPSLCGTLDDLVGHARRYTKQSLCNILNESGFKVQEQYYSNFFGAAAWFAAGKMLKQKRFNKGACNLLDKTFPFLQWLESGWKPPLGQSLVAICQKK